MKFVTAANAANLLGVSKPTFYRMAEEAPEGSLLAPIQSTGAKLWSLEKLMAYLAEKETAEGARRRALLADWGIDNQNPLSEG